MTIVKNRYDVIKEIEYACAAYKAGNSSYSDVKSSVLVCLLVFPRKI